MIAAVKEQQPAPVEYVKAAFVRCQKHHSKLSLFDGEILSLCAKTFLPPICSAMGPDKVATGSSSGVAQSACSAFARMLVHLPSKHVSQLQLKSFMHLDECQSQHHRLTVAAGMHVLFKRPDLLRILFGAPPHFADTGSEADLDWRYE